VAKVNAAGNAFEYCGYIGGSEDDLAYSIAVDSVGRAYITGHTDSTEATFPVTVGPDLTFMATRTRFGGQGQRRRHRPRVLWLHRWVGFGCGSGIAVDLSGNAYVVGDAVDFDGPSGDRRPRPQLQRRLLGRGRVCGQDQRCRHRPRVLRLHRRVVGRFGLQHRRRQRREGLHHRSYHLHRGELSGDRRPRPQLQRRRRRFRRQGQRRRHRPRVLWLHRWGRVWMSVPASQSTFPERPA